MDYVTISLASPTQTGVWKLIKNGGLVQCDGHFHGTEAEKKECKKKTIDKKDLLRKKDDRIEELTDTVFDLQKKMIQEKEEEIKSKICVLS